MQGVAQSPLAIHASVTRAAVKGRFSWNRSANVFDLELPGVEGSERGGFVIFMQEAVPLHHPLHARPRAGVVLYGLGVNVLVQTTRFGHP